MNKASLGLLAFTLWLAPSGKADVFTFTMNTAPLVGHVAPDFTLNVWTAHFASP